MSSVWCLDYWHLIETILSHLTCIGFIGGFVWGFFGFLWVFSAEPTMSLGQLKPEKLTK